MNIFAGRVVGNKTENGLGGAIYSSDATFTTGRLSKSCWSQGKCNYYAHNTAKLIFGTASVGVSGGAVACVLSTMSITNTVFAYNRTDFGTAVSASVCDTTIRASTTNNKSCPS